MNNYDFSKIEFYDNAMNDIIESYNLPWVKSIYQYGAVNNPGISDLDVIIVEDINFQTDNFWKNNKDIKSKLSKITKEVMGHASLIFAPDTLFENVNIHDQLTLTNKKGFIFDIKNYPDYKSSKLTMLRLIDWLPERLLLNRKILKSDLDKFNTRLILGFVKSVCHSVHQFSVYSGYENKKLIEFVTKVNELRFNLEKSTIFLSKERKFSLLNLSKDCLEDMIFSLSEIIDFKFINREFNSSESLFEINIPSRGKIIYSRNISFKNEEYISLPLSFALQWIYYFQNGFQFACSQKNNPIVKREIEIVDKSLIDILHKRFELAQVWIEYKKSRYLRPSILKNGFI